VVGVLTGKVAFFLNLQAVEQGISSYNYLIRLSIQIVEELLISHLPKTPKESENVWNIYVRMIKS
jgi:hypothetical protein